MRKILLTVMMVLLMAPAAYAAQGKIGIVNMPKIIKTCEPGQKALKSLQGKFKGVKADIDKKKAALDKMQKEMQKQSLVLSQEAKMDKEMEFKRKVRDFQDTLGNYQRKARVEEQRLSEPVVKLIMQTIQKYGKSHGYSMILDGQAAGVMYIDKGVDVTNTIIVEVNKASRKK